MSTTGEAKARSARRRAIERVRRATGRWSAGYMEGE